MTEDTETEVLDLDALLAETEPDSEPLENAEAVPLENGDESAQPTLSTDDTATSMLRREIAQNAERDIRTATKQIGRDLPFDDDFVETFMTSEARKDRRLAQAFFGRNDNPTAWARAIEKMHQSLARQVPAPIDQGVTEDREAVRAAARSGVHTADTGVTAEQIAGMSKAQFEAEQRRHGVKPYGT